MFGKFKKMMGKKEEAKSRSPETEEEIEEIEEIEDEEIEEIEDAEDSPPEAEQTAKIGEDGRRKSRQEIEAAMRANNEAISFQRAGRMEEALEHYQKAISHYPEYSTAYFNRALLYAKEGDIDKALADYSQAIEVGQDPEYYNNRGNLYLKKGEYDNARRDYDQALALSPNYAEAYHNRAQLSVVEGNLEEALQDFLRAVKLNISLVGDHFNIACLYARDGKLDQALEYLEKAYDEGYTNHEQVANDPDLQPLHDNPAFKDLLERWQYPKNTLALKMTRSTSKISIHQKHWVEPFEPQSA